MGSENNNNEKSYIDIYNEYMQSIAEEDKICFGNFADSDEDIADDYIFEKNNTDNRNTSGKKTVTKKLSDFSVIRNRAGNLAADRSVSRKGLKHKLKRFASRRNIAVALLVVAVIIVISVIVSAVTGNNSKPEEPATTVAPTTVSNSYQIADINVISQDTLLAGCEIYACTMLLQYLDYDIDEFEFADNYLITYPMSWDEDGNRYGPDMNSAFAGDVYTGFGINAPAMTKSMNSYLETTDKNKKAYNTTGTPLEELCEEYVKKDIPVMVWATARMDEPYIEKTWIVDYVDENATAKIGDTYGWNEHEHCLVLVGYDETNYYFCDSLEGCIMGYERSITEERYAQLGSQSIVVK